ncbi:diguanylate cyclase [Blastococcus sp. LR1]|uniref:GGDEF domain-containing protein n=1 Tax=Blastococcus sp. LR1 TaxID=2877000 RepID=UPI001CCB6D9D|nr:GGDEF domain-containing protein [Blastococcus sp. LR1]MCA0146132.1 GGDEF domain-containing protein [Blastococcus sp. LR1]
MPASTAPIESAAIRWLRGDLTDRSRYADMSRRFRHAPYFGAAIGTAKVLASFWYGPALLVLVGLGFGTMGAALAWQRRGRNTPAITAAAFIALEVNLAVSVLITGGGSSALLPLLVVPVATQAVCFRPQVLAAGGLLSGCLATLAVLLAPAFGPAPEAPPVVHLVTYLALLASLGLGVHYLASAERDSRDEAVTDPMTGLLNRLSLSARFTEAVRAGGTEGSVGLVMCDVDHFKQVNDAYGHERGDQVLIELAIRLRGILREADLAYRVGGEEFVLLLPGRDAGAAERVAERIRRAVAATPLAGLAVTVSVGVATAVGDSASLSQLLREADGALYRAKRDGRDRVVLAA